MSIEREAWSAERGAPCTVPCLGCFTVCTRHRTRRSGAAFTLIELLVVVAIIAVLSALITPAVQGLMGTSGRRGALNTVTAVLEQARLSAIENGANAYVGFPTDAKNKTNGFSHLIVFRDPAPNRQPPETKPVAVTRWQRLPNGVFYELSPALSGALTNPTLSPRTLPRLGGSEDLTKIPALAFNRFGQLQGASTAVSVLLGEKIEPTGEWRGSASNYYELRIQPLTGRVIVDDASL